MDNLETITITLDGLAVSGLKGTTILELARESGISIPTLCSDPNLEPIGACRICVVQDEKTGNLMASCVTPVASGMVINTRSPTVIDHRKNIISLLLASHPDTCMVCDKGNRCQLRQIATELGIGLTELYRIPQTFDIMDVNPYIERDLSKCILCGKCIRADQELVVEGAIDYFDRGFITRPATFGNVPLERSECTFCGTCVSVCPTGALSEKEKPYRSTTGTSGETTCPYCACGCTLSVEVKENQIIRVRPGKLNTVNEGALCVLGSYGLDFVHHKDRLIRPLIKVDGKLVEADWDKALGMAADGFRRIKDNHGGYSIAILGSPVCSNEDNYVLQRFARCALGTNNIDNGSKLFDDPDTYWNYLSFYGALRPISFINEADVILLVGADPEESAPIVSYAIKRSVKFGKSKLVIVDPLETVLHPMAYSWLRPVPGTEAALFNGIIQVIINQNLWGIQTISEKTMNFKELVKTLKDYTPQKVEGMTGVPEEQLNTVARLYASAKAPLVILGTNLDRRKNGGHALQAVVNLLILGKNAEIEKSNLLSLYDRNNSLGASDMGALPGYLPGYVNVADSSSRKIFENHWGIKILDKPGLGRDKLLSGLSEGKIKGLYIVGDNFANTDHDSEIKEAISAAEFVVVQDIFLSETAQLANVVLPSAGFAEREGTYTNLEGRVQKIKPLLSTVGFSLPDWQITVKLAERMGTFFPFNTIAQVRSEIEELVPIYKGISRLDNPTVKKIDTLKVRNERAQNMCNKKDNFLIAKRQIKADKSDKGYTFTPVPYRKLPDFGTGSRVGKATRISKIKQDVNLERQAK